MKYSVEEILNNIVIATLSCCTIDEFSERLAMFFRRYMPVSGINVSLYYNYNITRLSSYSYDKEYDVQRVLKIPTKLLEKLEQEELTKLSPFEIRIYSEEKGSMHEELLRMAYKKTTTSLYIPIHCTEYDKGWCMLYISIYTEGKNVYTDGHIELCEILRSSFAFSLMNIILREKIDLQNAHLMQHPSAPFQQRSTQTAFTPQQPIATLEQHTTAYIRHVLRHTHGRVGGKGGAAELLGLNVNTLWSKIRKFHIDIPKKGAA